MNAKKARSIVKRILFWTAIAIPVLLLSVFGIAYARSTNVCDLPNRPAPKNPMNAFTHCDYGAPDVLRLENVEKPVPGDNEVLVKVRAVSVNPYDWHMVRGEPFLARLAGGLRKPAEIRVGIDYSGTIEAVGTNVTQFKPGDEVFGGRNGAFAQYVRQRADGGIARKPANVTFEQAAGVNIAAVTALQSLRDRAQVRAGQKVLINGASGGVGTYMVQIAKTFGLDVTGVCSTRNVEMVRSLGADRVVDYTKEDFTASAERYDVILDNVGNRSLSEFRRVLKPEGKYIQIGAGGPGDYSTVDLLGRILSAKVQATLRSQDLGFFMAQSSQKDLTVLGEMMQSGKLKTVIDRQYPFRELPDALRYLETGRARGKVIVTVD